jgi:alpha-1,3-glucan synthase
MHAAAPGTPSTHPFGESSILQHGEDFVIMNRVQIALARRIFGWPLYTIIIALGQASCLFFITPFVY